MCYVQCVSVFFGNIRHLSCGFPRIPMASLGSVITRGLISLLHIFIGISSGVCVIYTLARWGSLEHCLPPMVQLSGGTLMLKSQLPDACDCIYTSFTVVAFLHLAMCAFVNFLWRYRNNIFLLVNLILCLVVAAFCIFVASMMTTYRMVWCDVMVQRMSNHFEIDCETAALHYTKMTGSRNMTLNYDRIELQMIKFWALVPMTVVIIFLYGIAMTLQRFSTPTVTPAPADTGDTNRVTTSTSPQPNVPATTPSRDLMDESTPLLINFDDPVPPQESIDKPN